MNEELEKLLTAYEDLYSACIEEGIDIEIHRELLTRFAQKVADGASLVAVMEQIKEINIAKEIKKYKK